ncbi:MAG: hypothetical protein JWM12_3972 [Ilumatobacteraceae bacterium]|nr:hypothetical protein [Ilumatobacteraceae bacterium]
MLVPLRLARDSDGGSHDLDQATNRWMPVEGLAHPLVSGPGDRGSSPSVSITGREDYSPSPQAILPARDQSAEDPRPHVTFLRRIMRHLVLVRQSELGASRT